MNVFTGKVVQSARSQPSRYDARCGPISFPPSGSDALVCGNCKETLEQNVDLSGSVHDHVECLFCHQIIEVPASSDKDLAVVKSLGMAAVGSR